MDSVHLCSGQDSHAKSGEELQNWPAGTVTNQHAGLLDEGAKEILQALRVWDS